MPRTRLGVRLVTQALRGAPLPPASLEMWRAVEFPREPDDASGSSRYVGRWHNPATTRALYVARLRGTAIAEATSHMESGRHTLTVAQLTVMVPALLDLTQAAIRDRLPFPISRCLADTRVAPMRGAVMGDAAMALGATALLAPCRSGPEACLCLYEICPNTIHIVSRETIDVIIP